MKQLRWLWALLAVAIFFIAFMYLTEGFATALTTDEVLGDKVGICKAKTKCGDCLSVPQCGWCSESSACVPRIQAGGPDVYAIVPRWLTDLGKTCLQNTFITMAGKCPDVECGSITTCRDCAGNAKCGWCADAKKCLPKDAMTNNPIVPSGTTCLSTTFITTSSTCPALDCTTITDCATCTNNTGCGFCKDTSKCITLSPTSFTGEIAGTTLTVSAVANGAISIDSPIMGAGVTPDTKVTALGTGTGGIGTYTVSASQTVASTMMNASAPSVACPIDSIVTFGTQCPGASAGQSAEDRAKAMAMMASLGAGSGNMDQMPQAWDGTMQMNEVRPDTGKPVSPAKTYSHVTAPGVARPVGARSIPPLVRHDPAFGDAPLESYVKLLVNSQLAKQGVPMNEYFQVREADAIPNATGYMKKVFRGVFN